MLGALALGTSPPAIRTGTLDVSTGEGTCTATIESLGTTAAEYRGGPTPTGTRSDWPPLADPFRLWHHVRARGVATGGRWIDSPTRASVSAPALTR